MKGLCCFGAPWGLRQLLRHHMGCAATVTGQPWLLVFSVQDPDPDGCGWEWSQQHWGSWGRVQSLFEFAPRCSDRRRLHWKTFCTALCITQGPSVDMRIACQEFTPWRVSACFIQRIKKKYREDNNSWLQRPENVQTLWIWHWIINETFIIISDVCILHLEAASLTSMIYTGSWGAPESNCMFTSTLSNRRAARQPADSDKPARYLKKSAKLLLYKHCHCLTVVFREHDILASLCFLSSLAASNWHFHKLQQQSLGILH